MLEVLLCYVLVIGQDIKDMQKCSQRLAML